MIVPKLDYCNFVWNNVASRYKTLERLQTRVAIIVLKDGHLKPGLHYRKFLAHSSGEIGTGAKKELSKFCLHCTIFTVPKIPCQNFRARISSLGDMHNSVRSKDRRRSLCAVSLKKDVSQSSKLNYGHRSRQKFAGKNLLP